MKRFALVAALLLVALLPGSAQASITQFQSGINSCTQIWNNSGQPVPFVCLTESVQYSGDKLIFTGSSDHPNLFDLNHTLPGDCDTGQLDGSTWDNCITAVWAKLGTNDSICLHDRSNYEDLLWWAHAPAVPAGGVWTYALADFGSNSDKVTSVRLQQSGASCNTL